MARKYPMTVEEIVTSYRQAKNQQTQIGVLADLNVCTRKEIKELLTEAGALQQPPESKAGRPVTFDTEEARRLWDEGLPDAEIAARLEIPTVRFAKWRQRVGLLRPRTPQKKQDRNGTGGAEREKGKRGKVRGIGGDGEGPAGAAGCGGGSRIRRRAAGAGWTAPDGAVPAGGNADRHGNAWDAGGAAGHGGRGVKTEKPSPRTGARAAATTDLDTAACPESTDGDMRA